MPSEPTFRAAEIPAESLRPDRAAPIRRRQRTSYAECLAAAERIQWRVEDLIGGEKRLDFTKPFLPESLAATDELEFLSGPERLALNQIRGHGYLCMFLTVEAVILPFVLEHAGAKLDAEDAEVRALLEFAAEEAKHTHLFRRFRAEFERGFPVACAFLEPEAEIATAIRRKGELAVTLVMLMVEWMTHDHYVQSVLPGSREQEPRLDPLFASLLRHHWLEEAQHAKIDALLIEELAAGRTADEIAAALDELFDVVAYLGGKLERQAELDLESLESASKRRLAPAERGLFLQRQLRSLHWTFLGSGLLHPKFHETLDVLHPLARGRALAAAADPS